MVEIIELQDITDSQIQDLLVLMNELNPEIYVDANMLRRVAESPVSHLFAMKEADGQIIGTASLCVFDSPTGRKAHIEDVVVLSAYRGQQLGKRQVEHLISFASRELGAVDIYLTSSPFRVAANGLYKALGFKQKDTNVYKLIIKDSVMVPWFL